MSKFNAVLFDLDGTLVDTAPDFVLAANALRAEHKLAPLAAEKISITVSDGSAAVTAAALEIEIDNSERFSKARARLLELYQNTLGQEAVIYPGLNETLKTLETKSIRWGIVTNKPAQFAAPLLESLKIDQRCGVLICPDHVKNAKPDPAGILMGIEKLSSTADNCLYVGDHARDIEAAKRAKCISVAATYGYLHTDCDPEDWDADFVTASSQDLCTLLETLFN